MKWLLVIGLLGCSVERDRYPVHVQVMVDDGNALSGVSVELDGERCQTHSDGRCSFSVRGAEGSRRTTQIEVPSGYRLLGSGELSLRRIEDSKGHPLPLEQRLTLTPTERDYVVLVRTGVPNLAIETFGIERARTNAFGVAAFVYHGVAGDELQVRVSTAGRHELRPQNPVSTLVLSATPEAYLVKQHFSRSHTIKRHVHRIRRHGPRRL